MIDSRYKFAIIKAMNCVTIIIPISVALHAHRMTANGQYDHAVHLHAYTAFFFPL